MNHKKVFIVILLALGSGYFLLHNSQKRDVALSSLTLTNIEALASTEERKCPDPYDVYDHQLQFKEKEGRFTVDTNGEINILGKKFKVGGAGASTTITATYLLADCNKPSPGNCCPNSRNGEVTLLGFRY